MLVRAAFADRAVDVFVVHAVFTFARDIKGVRSFFARIKVPHTFNSTREVDGIDRVGGGVCVGRVGVPDFRRNALVAVVLVHADAAVAVGIACERSVFVVAIVAAIAQWVDFLGNLPFGAVNPLGHIAHRVEHGGEVAGRIVREASIASVAVCHACHPAGGVERGEAQVEDAGVGGSAATTFRSSHYSPIKL